MAETDGFEVGGVFYDKGASKELREQVIKIRDKCLGPEIFDPKGAVVLSHIIGWMHHVIEKAWEEQ